MCVWAVLEVLLFWVGIATLILISVPAVKGADIATLVGKDDKEAVCRLVYQACEIGKGKGTSLFLAYTPFRHISILIGAARSSRQAMLVLFGEY